MINRHLIVVSAPSGAGKTTLVHALANRCSGLKISTSYTTRAPRNGEQEGEHYFFVSPDAFQSLKSSEQFIETAKIFGHSYGTHRERVMDHITHENNVILEIDWQGHQSVREHWNGPLCSIFIMPPSLQVLKNRLIQRGDSSDSIERRIAQAHADIQHARDYDFVVINESFEEALNELHAIVTAIRAQNPLWAQINRDWFEKSD